MLAFKRSAEFVDFFSTDGDIASLPESRDDSHEKPLQSRSVAAVDQGRNTSSQSPNHADAIDEQVDRIPVRLPGGRRAWLLIPSPFFTADKDRLKAQIDLLLAEDEDMS